MQFDKIANNTKPIYEIIKINLQKINYHYHILFLEPQKYYRISLPYKYVKYNHDFRSNINLINNFFNKGIKALQEINSEN